MLGHLVTENFIVNAESERRRGVVVVVAGSAGTKRPALMVMMFSRALARSRTRPSAATLFIGHSVGNCGGSVSVLMSRTSGEDQSIHGTRVLYMCAA